jgi:DNA polymerase III epsilon subunit-like protein
MQLRNRFIDYIPYFTTKPTQEVKKHDENIIMFFDTETTGLFKDGKIPYLIQLAFILYDIEKGKIIQTYKHYVKLPSYVEINQECIKIHGITQSMLNQHGVSILDALTAFYNAYMRSSKIIGHNIKFDIQVIRAELLRNYDVIIASGISNPKDVFDSTYQDNNKIQNICTMYNTVNYCDIKVESKRPNKDGSKSYYKKFPRLNELYKSIFKIEPDMQLHDALEDVKVCMNCYLELKDKMNFTDLPK